MKVIIPVAGIGTRLRPLTHTAPKVLLHVAGKPILAHVLEGLKGLKIDEVIFVIGFMGEKIIDYVKKNYRFKSTFIKQKELKGVGYAVHIAARRVTKGEPVLIILGDTVFKMDLKPVIKGSYDSLGIKEVDNPGRFGVVKLKYGFATELIEKPDKPISNKALVGVYYIKSSQLLKTALQEILRKDIRTRGEYQLTDALQLMINKGIKFSTFDISGWFDCGKPETLLDTNRHLLSLVKKTRQIKGSVIVPPVFIPRSCRIENSIIGPNVSVGKNAFIHNSVIKNSILGEKSEVSFCLLDSSLVGNNSQVLGKFQRLNLGDSSEIGIYM
ncbi:MAG: sugar phosphate nucleotidyltransferase [candidate division Zixibacteria bacterium]|nr:sugar phosphate nucleotidyltransferase [candidate division Zixibacteria bacterium]